MQKYIDIRYINLYNVDELANLNILGDLFNMSTKSVSSTQAQNNFGRLLDDVTRNSTRYVIQRRGVPSAIILSFEDFSFILENESERLQLDTLLKELRPKYGLGDVLDTNDIPN